MNYDVRFYSFGTFSRFAFIEAILNDSFLSFFFFFFFEMHRAVCGILVPCQGWNLGPQQRKHRVLTTGLPGNSLNDSNISSRSLKSSLLFLIMSLPPSFLTFGHVPLHASVCSLHKKLWNFLSAGEL